MRAPRAAAFALALLTMLVVASLTGAHEIEAGKIRVEHPWARATPPHATTAAVYMTLFLAGETPDRLISAETSIAERLEFHLSTVKEGIARMQPVSAIELTPEKQTKVEPGGLHLMLIGLKQPLVEDSVFPVTLHFERAGAVEIEVYVEAPQSRTDHPH